MRSPFGKQVEKLEERISFLEDLNFQWQDRYDEHVKRYSEQQGMIQKLRAWVKDHSQDAEKLKVLEQRDANGRQAELEKELEEERARYDTMCTRLGEVERGSKDKDQKIVELRRMVEEVEQQHTLCVEQLENQVAALGAQKRELRTEKEEALRELKKRIEAGATEERAVRDVERKDKELKGLNDKLSSLESVTIPKIEGENRHLQELIEKCFAKMSREQSEKIYSVDRRIVVEGLKDFLSTDGKIMETLLSHTFTTEREHEYYQERYLNFVKVADLLGFSHEERESIGLGTKDEGVWHALRAGAAGVQDEEEAAAAAAAEKKKGFSDQFLEFLEREVADE